MRRFRWRAIGAVLLAVSLIGWAVDARLFFAAWLAAWWFCLGLVFGAASNAWIHRLTGGAWGVALRPAIAELVRPLPWLWLFFLPVLVGLRLIYPWADPGSGWTATMSRPEFAEAWFALPFFIGRLVAYALLLTWLARPARNASAGSAAAALIGYMLVASLAAFDLLMSLQAAWVSTVFGWLATVGQMLGGTAAAVALAAVEAAGQKPATAAAPWPAARKGVPVWRDLGNLLLMYLMMQAYLQFMQFLVIWAENLPRETSWYVVRLQTGWAGVGLATVLLQFALPFIALLWRRVKDDPRRLAVVAAGIVVMQAMGSAWLVVPSVDSRNAHAAWLLPLVFAGMTLLLFGGVPAALRAKRLAGESSPADPAQAAAAPGPTAGAAGATPGGAHA